MDRKKRLVSGLLGADGLSYRPVQDTVLVVLSFLLVGIIVLVTLVLRPDLDNVHVEIRYGRILLWDPDDPDKRTDIPFPDEGEYVITYTREDGEMFLGPGEEFQFYGEVMQVTLYADKSIQITKQESPRNVCANLGRIYSAYLPLVCMPNNFTATIVAGYFPEWDA